MKKTLVAVVSIAAAVVSSGSGRAQSLADVARPVPKPQQYTVRIELRKTPGAESEPADNPLAAMGQMIRQVLLPDGSAEMLVTTDGESSRTQLRGRYATMVSGTVMLTLASQPNTSYILNPADKTFYVVSVDGTQLGAGMVIPQPEVSVKRTGSYETILGYRAERVDVAFRMPIPFPEGVDVPAGVPTDLTMAMELWCTSDLRTPSANAALVTGSIGRLFPGAADQMSKACGMPMRSRLRMSILAGYEMLTTMTAHSEDPIPAGSFTVPIDYKEVPKPTPRLPGGLN